MDIENEDAYEEIPKKTDRKRERKNSEGHIEVEVPAKKKKMVVPKEEKVVDVKVYCICKTPYDDTK